MKKRWKKTALLIALTLCLSLLAACGTTEYTEEDVGNRFYVYEGEGCGGSFSMTLFADGSFQYYEGYLSSYIGMGTWTLEEGNVLCIRDEEMTRFKEDGTTEEFVRTNYFKVEKDRLVWMEEHSDNFLYVDVEDGGVFSVRYVIELPTLDEARKMMLDEDALSAVSYTLAHRLQYFTSADLEEAWGEPDGRCSGLWCSFWNLDETCYLAVYFGDEGHVREVFLGLREQVDDDTAPDLQEADRVETE